MCFIYDFKNLCRKRKECFTNCTVDILYVLSQCKLRPVSKGNPSCRQLKVVSGFRLLFALLGSQNISCREGASHACKTTAICTQPGRIQSILHPGCLLLLSFNHGDPTSGLLEFSKGSHEPPWQLWFILLGYMCDSQKDGHLYFIWLVLLIWPTQQLESEITA